MFEYKVVEYKQPKFMEEGINKMAKEGWQAVSTACRYNALVIIVVPFEGEKQ